jgi:hypothetical protein
MTLTPESFVFENFRVQGEETEGCEGCENLCGENGLMDGWMNGWMDRGTDGRMDEWMHG